MLLNAIGMKILRNDPRTLLLVWAAATIFAALFVRGLLYAFLALLDWLRMKWSAKYRAKKKREATAELQRKYESVCAEVVELRKDNERLAVENVRLVRLVREEQSHAIDYASRARGELRARPGT